MNARLKAIVIGGGIGGLAAAIGLQLAVSLRAMMVKLIAPLLQAKQLERIIGYEV